jgi:transposase
VGQQFVGIDLHRRRSVIVRTAASGEVLESVRIASDADRLTEVIARAGEAPEVVLEATYGWYWAVDALQAAGAGVHLAHPLGVKAFEYRRVKNDVRDARWGPTGPGRPMSGRPGHIGIRRGRTGRGS